MLFELVGYLMNINGEGYLAVLKFGTRFLKKLISLKDIKI